MAHNDAGSNVAFSPSRSQTHSGKFRPVNVNFHSDAAHISRDVANGLTPQEGQGLPGSPAAAPSRPAESTAGLPSSEERICRLQKVWERLQPHDARPVRTGNSLEPSATPSDGSISPAAPFRPGSSPPSPSEDGASSNGQPNTPEIERVESDVVIGPRAVNKRSAGPDDAFAGLLRDAKRARHEALLRVLPRSGEVASESRPRLNTASMPQTSSKEVAGSSRPGSGSSSDVSIPFNRNFRADLLDAKRPIRVRDPGSDSGSAADTDSAPESKSQAPSARPLRQRASLPVYNLKQLSGHPSREKRVKGSNDSNSNNNSNDEEGGEYYEAVATRDDDNDVDETLAEISQVQFDETKPLRFCGDRPYGDWVGILDGKRTRLAGAGALFPKGYAPIPNTPKPWICPLRNCRKLFPSAWALGGHFNMGHRTLMLNDNCDGTMTVVGKREFPEATGRFPAIVVSATPLPSDGEDVYVEPQPEKSKRNGPINPLGPRQVPDVDTVQAAAKSQLWTHLLGMLPKATRLPDYPPALGLLTLPQRRFVPDDVEAKLRTGQIDTRLDVRAFCALLIYLTGSGGLCNHCSDPKRATRTFDTCIALHPLAPPMLRKAFGASTCCNCYLERPTPPCVMVRSNLADPQAAETHGMPATATVDKARFVTDPARKPLDAARVKEVPDEKGDGDDEASTERRPTRRLSRNEPPPRPSVARTSSASQSPWITPVPIPTYPQQASRKRPIPAAPVAVSVPVPVPPQPDINTLAASLELEDWEFAPGRVRDETQDEPENIAFSTAYLSQNQTVTVAQDVTFRVEMIKPGSSVRLTADAERLRICSVASGKVRVKVAGQEFAVGPNGVWKVKGGVGCAVENRYYLDAVVHVSSIPCHD